MHPKINHKTGVRKFPSLSRSFSKIIFVKFVIETFNKFVKLSESKNVVFMCSKYISTNLAQSKVLTQIYYFCVFEIDILD